MTYVSLSFYVLVAFSLVLYYILPVKIRWIALLAANAVFYLGFNKTGWWIFGLVALISYFVGLILPKLEGRIKTVVMVAGIVGVTIPWVIVKNGQLLLPTTSFIVPLGISFYTLQIISYIVDVYKNDIVPEKNIFKYVLFISFFPQVIQGPIPRYSQLGEQLKEGHLFDEEKFIKGFYLIIWGFFLKWMIADKAGIIVDTIFDKQPSYAGAYIWVGSILYSTQLYADFRACTTIAQGVSKLFGIELIDNFKHPYLATSVKDFWRRWHMSLSSWLRDYVYIPLGGNRKGKARKLINVLITFAISGIWHGAGFKFLLWGILHAVYQIFEELFSMFKAKYKISITWSKGAKTIWTFFWVNLAWIIFRADTLMTALNMIKSMFTDYNIWVLFNDRLFTLGLVWKEWVVLVVSIILLFVVGINEEKGKKYTDLLYMKKLPIRWIICILAIVVIAVFGTYGYGFNANDFIYGGF